MKSTVRLLGTVMMTALLTVALLASRPSGATAGDKDCKDFRTQRAAQFFFLRHGGPRYAPDRLDGDNDGVACEDKRVPATTRSACHGGSESTSSAIASPDLEVRSCRRGRASRGRRWL